MLKNESKRKKVEMMVVGTIRYINYSFDNWPISFTNFQEWDVYSAALKEEPSSKMSMVSDLDGCSPTVVMASFYCPSIRFIKLDGGIMCCRESL